MLLLRTVFALALLAQSGSYFSDGDTPAKWVVGAIALVAGILLLIGFLTPVAGAVVGVLAIGIAFSVIPHCTPNLFDSKLPVVFGSAILVAIVLIGPGAFSADARVFGRREIIIPPRSPRPEGNHSLT